MSNSAGTAKDSNARFEVNGKKAMVYDFRVPKKFTRDDIKIINRITDSFAKMMTSELCTMTRENCSVYHPRIEEISCPSYLDSLPKNTMIGIISFNIPGLDLRDSRVMFQMPPDLSFMLIDILLGGNKDQYIPDRPHTDIEVNILKYVISRFTELMYDAWSPVVEGEFRYEKSETNPKLVENKGEGDVKLVMRFDVSVKNTISSISIAYSAQMLEDLMSKLDSTPVSEQNFEPVDLEKDAKRREMLMENLADATMELKAIFAELTLDTKDIMSLNVGDIIPLYKKLTDDITVTVDGVPWFKGKLGQLNLKKAVKITENIREEEE